MIYFNSKFKIQNSKSLLVYLLLLMPLAACQRDRNHPGYSYFPDMAKSQAYKYYTENPNFKDGKTAQPAVHGTIPRGSIPYPYTNTSDDQKLAGKELVNPIGDSAEDIEIGRQKYLTYCSMCHGEKGQADGNLVQSKKFTMPVAHLDLAYVQNKPDGELFHVITVGSVSRFMGPHSLQLKPDDRWRIVRYIKTKLKSE